MISRKRFFPKLHWLLNENQLMENGFCSICGKGYQKFNGVKTAEAMI